LFSLYNRHNHFSSLLSLNLGADEILNNPQRRKKEFNEKLNFGKDENRDCNNGERQKEEREIKINIIKNYIVLKVHNNL
jgi:hypothetical protein